MQGWFSLGSQENGPWPKQVLSRSKCFPYGPAPRCRRSQREPRNRPGLENGTRSTGNVQPLRSLISTQMPPSHGAKPSANKGAPPQVRDSVWLPQKMAPSPLWAASHIALPMTFGCCSREPAGKPRSPVKRYTKGNFALYQFQLAFQWEMKEIQKIWTKTFWPEMC